MQENLILAYYAQIWKFAPAPPKMEFFKNFSFLWKGLQISLLTSPQPPQTLSLSQVMQENVFWLIMPKYGNSAPGSQKWNFSKNFHFSDKVFITSLLTEPSTTCRQFKSSYARKHIIKKVESRTQLLNPEQGKTSPLLKGSIIISIGGPSWKLQL